MGKPALLTSKAAITPEQTNCDKTAGLSSFWGCFSEFVLMHLTNRVEDSLRVAVSDACARTREGRNSGDSFSRPRRRRRGAAVSRQGNGRRVRTSCDKYLLATVSFFDCTSSRSGKQAWISESDDSCSTSYTWGKSASLFFSTKELTV